MIELYASHKMVVWLSAVIVSVLICLLHYRQFSPNCALSNEKAGSGEEVQRFNNREWVSHWLMLIGFIILAGTGFAQLVPGTDPHEIGPMHGWLGFIVFVITAITLVGWIPSAIFQSVDIAWMRGFGGYLSSPPTALPAGRFNAGQKIYFWGMLLVFAALLVSAIIMEHGSHTPEGRKALFWCVHGILGLLAAAMVIGHGYLSLFADPATISVLKNGRVAQSYVDEHHALWEYQRESGKKEEFS